MTVPLVDLKTQFASLEDEILARVRDVGRDTRLFLGMYP